MAENFADVLGQFFEGRIASAQAQNNFLLRQKQLEQGDERLALDRERLDLTTKLTEAQIANYENNIKTNQEIADQNKAMNQRADMATHLQQLLGSTLTPKGGWNSWLNENPNNIYAMDDFFKQHSPALKIFKNGDYDGIEQLPGRENEFAIRLKKPDGNIGYLTNKAGTDPKEEILIFDNNSVNGVLKVVQMRAGQMLGTMPEADLAAFQSQIASANERLKAENKTMISTMEDLIRVESQNFSVGQPVTLEADINGSKSNDLSYLPGNSVSQLSPFAETAETYDPLSSVSLPSNLDIRERYKNASGITGERAEIVKEYMQRKGIDSFKEAREALINGELTQNPSSEEVMSLAREYQAVDRNDPFTKAEIAKRLIADNPRLQELPPYKALQEAKKILRNANVDTTTEQTPTTPTTPTTPANVIDLSKKLAKEKANSIAEANTNVSTTSVPLGAVGGLDMSSGFPTTKSRENLRDQFTRNQKAGLDLIGQGMDLSQSKIPSVRELGATIDLYRGTPYLKTDGSVGRSGAGISATAQANLMSGDTATGGIAATRKNALELGSKLYESGTKGAADMSNTDMSNQTTLITENLKQRQKVAKENKARVKTIQANLKNTRAELMRNIETIGKATYSQDPQKQAELKAQFTDGLNNALRIYPNFFEKLLGDPDTASPLGANLAQTFSDWQRAVSIYNDETWFKNAPQSNNLMLAIVANLFTNATGEKIDKFVEIYANSAADTKIKDASIKFLLQDLPSILKKPADQRDKEILNILRNGE